MIRRALPFVAIFAATISMVVAVVVYVRLSDNDSQFCELNAQRLIDKQHQFAQTADYLASPAGQDPSGLNVFIRTTSQPRLRKEIRSDMRTLPDSCRDEYDALKK